MKGSKWLKALVISIAAAFGALAIACGDNKGNKDNKPFDSPAIGVYYYDNGNTEYLLSLNKDKTVALTIGDVPISGKWSIKDGAITFSVKSDKLGTAATYANDEVTLTYDGGTYKFLRNVEYTVKFNTGSGSAVADATVRNGKKLTKPADPTYSGHVFVGWYKTAADAASAVNSFKFATETVRGDFTLYAGWVEKTEGEEYTVKFDLGYGSSPLYKTETTVNGKVYTDMQDPERDGYTFKGWWLKDAASGEYAHRVDLEKYTFVQNETLYAMWQGAAEGGKLAAPVVDIDVANNRIFWDAVDGADSYSVKVTDPDNKVWTRTERGTSLTYSDGFTKAGAYTVEVYAVSAVSADKNSPVTTRKFVNKQLARVSGFAETGDTLTFSGVENATEYELYVYYGTLTDEQFDDLEPAYEGSSKEYDFSDWEMREGGIKFVVVAKADGYASSRSEEYVVDRTLDKATGFAYNEQTQTVSWTAVQNAASYRVKVECTDAEHVVETEVRGATSIGIGDCAAGDVKVTVVALNAKKYNPSESAEYKVNKKEAAAVTGLAVSGNTLSWTAQPSADKYIVDIGGVTNEVTANSVDVTTFGNITFERGKTYTIKVRAVKGSSASSWSAPFTAAYQAMSDVTYNDGKVSWAAVFGATGFKVVVNDGTPVSVSTNSCDVTLIAKVNVIKVYLDGATASVKSVTVNAHKLTFDCTGGSGAPEAYYFATGDSIKLPLTTDVTRRGYDLTGWFNTATGAGIEYMEGDRYDKDTDITLYARWDGKPYTVKLNYNIKGDNTDTVKTVNVKFGDAFDFGVPEETKSAIHGFLHWNTAALGNSEELTDEFGASTSAWHYTDNNMVVYATWGEIFEFIKGGEGNDAYYTVRKGVATSKRTEIEVPDEYQAENDSRPYPVKVVGGNAFQSCFDMTSLSLPVSIDTIEPTAFTSLSKLQSVTIRDGVSGVTRYWSVDGVVYGVNQQTNRTQLELYPRGRRGDYTMPDGIDDIPYEGFAGVTIDTLTIPSSVTRIAESAFASGSSSSSATIYEIVFAEPTDDSAAVRPLNIMGGAFKSLWRMTDITLPSRTVNFTDSDGNVMTDIDFKADLFNGCSSLANIYVADGNADYISIDGMLCKKDANGSDITVVFCPNAHEFKEGKYVVNNRITVIGKHAFSGVKNLTDIEIGASVAAIADEAFSGFSAEINLKTVYVSSAKVLAVVTFKGGRGTPLTIGRNAFGNSVKTSFAGGGSTDMACTVLGTVTFEDNCNVTQIGNYAFANTNIKSIAFPDSLQKLGYGAFRNNANIKSVVFNGDEEGLELCNVFGTEEDELDKVGAFANCKNLETVEIPANVTVFSGGVFIGCDELKEIKVDPDNKVLVFMEGILYGKDAVSGKINAIHYILPYVDMSNFTLPDGITEISAGVFATVKDQIRELTINKYVTYIGTEAFKETGLQKIVFENKDPEDQNDDGADVLTLGTGVFRDCKNLTEISLPSRLTVIPDYTFYGTGISGIDLPDVTSIGDYAFKNTSSLTSIALPDTLITIGNSAFDHAGLDGTLTIPNSVQSIGNEAFYYCTSLDIVSFDDGGEEDLAFLDSDGNYGVTAGGEYAKSANTFNNCTSLTEVHLPERLVNIGAGSFRSCSHLERINIPAAVKTIGIGAFAYCNSLQCVTFDTRAADGTQTLNIQDGTDETHSGSSSSDTSLNGMFLNCTSLQEISLPKGLDRIPQNMFYGCSTLNTVHIPNTVRNLRNGSWNAVDKKAVDPILAIGRGAFRNCTLLSNVDFEADAAEDLQKNGNVVSIDEGSVFSGCSSLTQITLPARFGGYTKYTSATAVREYSGFSRSVFGATIQKIFVKQNGVRFSSDAEGLVYNADGTKLVFCPTGKTGKVTIANTVTSIKSGVNDGNTVIVSGAFSGCGIDEIEFSPSEGAGSPLEIGSADDANTVGVFNGCKGLTSVTLPARVSVVGKYAFSNCANLTYVSFDGTPTVTVIGDRAFADCPKLVGKNFGTEVAPDNAFVVPKTVESIGSGAFINDKALTAVRFDGMTFDDQGKVTSDTAALTSVGANAFEKTGLTSVYLPKTTAEAGNNVFANCSKLASAALPNTIDNLTGMFTNCGKLSKLELYEVEGQDSNFVSDSNSIVYKTNAQGKKILNYYPMSLTKKVLTAADLADVVEIADGAFGSNRYLEEITIPNTVTKIGANAFRHCSSLKKVTFESDTSATENSGLTITSGSTQGYAFWGCYSLEEVAFPKRVTAPGDYTLAYLPKLKKVTFPSDCKMTVVPQYLFTESGKEVAGGLTVNIPDNVTEMKGNVFKDANYVGSTEYTDAQSNKKIKLVIPASVKKFGSNIFKNTSVAEVEFKTPTTARSALTAGSSMFSGCKQLSSVVLPDDLVTTGSSLFLDCTALTEITIPQNVTTISGSTFKGCVNLEKVNSKQTVGTGAAQTVETSDAKQYEAILTAKITKIDSSAFFNCGKINKITLPDTLTTLGAQSLAGLGITEVTIPNKVSATAAWFTDRSDAKHLTDETKVASDSLTKVTFADDNAVITNIAASTFRFLPNLTTVRLPHNANKFTMISNGNTGTGSAFYMSGITSIEIPKTVVNIRHNTFTNCVDLETVTFEKDSNGDCALLWIGNNAFNNTGIKSISIPKSALFKDHNLATGTPSATSFAGSIFANCSKLESVTFENDSITQFVSSATSKSSFFTGCTSLKTVKLPASLTMPGADLFMGCTALETVTMPTNIGTIPTNMFNGCSSLKPIDLSGVTTIGDYAFYGAGCKPYTDDDGVEHNDTFAVTVPASVTTIGAYAFANSNVSSVTGCTNVTTIGNYAFRECAMLESFTVPATVTTIGNYAFYKSAVESITFAAPTGEPADLSIGSYAFAEGVLSGALVLPARLKTVGDYAFYKSAITSVAFAAEGETPTVTTINSYAFRQCTSLTSFVIPASVTTIGAYSPFAYCTSLTQIEVENGNTAYKSSEAKDAVYTADGSKLIIYAVGIAPAEGEELAITIDGDVTEVGGFAFFGGNVTKVTIGDNVTIGTYAFQANDITELVIGADVTVGTYAFRYNEALTSVTLGEGVVLQSGVFDYCGALREITIPARATVDVNAFSNCESLAPENITAADDVEIKSGSYDAVIHEDGTVSIVIYGDASGKIASSRFKSNTSITSVIIAEGVTSIESQAFYNCPNLTSVVLPSTLKTIGNWAFRDCTSLQTVNFPASLQSIDYYAFRNCPLQGLEIDMSGSQLKWMGSYVFAGTGIKSIKFPKTFNYVDDNAFNGCTALEAVYFAADGCDVKFDGYNPNTSTSEYKYPTSDTKIFYECTSLATFVFPGNQAKIPVFLLAGTAVTSIVIPSTVDEIGKNAFQNCASLGSVTIPANVALIGANAFDGCTSLAEVAFATEEDGSRVGFELGNYAFRGCGLTEVTLPVTLTKMGTNLFENCASLASVTFEKFADGTCGLAADRYGAVTIAGSAFKGTAITTISIPKNITSIGSSAFENCTQLATVVFEGLDENEYTLNTLGSLCFGNTAIESFVIPAKVTSVTKPFSGDKLTSLTLSPNTSAVPDVTLCTALTELIVPEGVATIGTNVKGMTGISRLVLPSTITGVSDGTFDGWTNEQIIEFTGIPAPGTAWGKYWRRGCNAQLWWNGEQPTETTEANDTPAQQAALPVDVKDERAAA